MKEIFKRTIIWVLTYEAKIVLRRTKPTIIAVTGSVGKTSTKDAIYSVLRNYKRVRKSQKSFNSDIGVALSVLGLQNAWGNPVFWLWNIIEGMVVALFSRDYPEILVLEVGVDRPGDMRRITQWLKPNIVVITRLPDVPVHVEYFDSPEAVCEEKLALRDALVSDGVFIYNHDDTKLQVAASETRQSTIGFSRYVPSHFTAGKDKIIYRDDMPIGTEFTISHVETTVQAVVKDTVGVAAAYTYAAAAAVASQFGIGLEDVVKTIATHTPPPGRMRVLSGIKGSTIIDDSYNSSPIATELALQTVKELTGFTRKVVVLGDMMELGRFSSAEHERIGVLVAQCADVLLTVGVRSRKTAEGALENGLSEKNIYQYEYADRASRELQNIIMPGDLILIKGSQSIRAEKIVEEVMTEPERASELLVRQDKNWKTR